MNDPHVVALLYRVCHNESVDYSKAKPLVLDQPDFRVEIKDRKARFELKQHYPTEEEARKLVDPFVRNWEFDASLRQAPGFFRLEFNQAEIIDRRPTKGVVELSASLRAGSPTLSVKNLTVLPQTYLPPSSGIDSDHPDVQTLYQRYESFCQGKELLTAFAYFCLTIVEHSVGPGKKLRRKAADVYGIEMPVLDEIGKLSSCKGGSEARKASGTNDPLTQDERRFLKRAVVRLIRRVAEYHGRIGGLSKISIKDINREP